MNFQSSQRDSSAAARKSSVHTDSVENSTSGWATGARGAKQRWIVVWKDGGPTDAACTEAEAADSGRFEGICSARYTHVFNGFAVEFTREELTAFLAAYAGDVASVHEDTEVKAVSVERPAPWALDRIDQPALPLNSEFDYYNLGTNVNIYVVDTGIHVTHQEFRYGDGALGSRASEVFTSLQSGRVGQDCNGHGTHVAAAAAGLTYGVAKNASLLAVRSLECLGNGTVSQVIEGLDWVRQHYVAPAVVVMALGGEPQYALDMAVRALALSGVPVVVAAGNEDSDACAKSPAREPLAITVAATARDDSRLWISPGVASNYGKCVDIWAPGEDIISASRRSDTATEFRSGTSQAVPFVAGTAALYLQNASDASPEEVVGVLTASGIWGVVYEPAESGPFNAHVLDDAPPILANIDMFNALRALPEALTIAGGDAGFAPTAVNVSLAQAPMGLVHAALNVSQASRATVYPGELTFTPDNWADPKVVWVSVGDAAWLTTDSDQFFIDLALRSAADSRYDGKRPRLRVVDRKGDTLEYPKVVRALPFWDSANTYFFNDDYTLNCPGDYTDQGGGKDVAYYLAPEQDAQITVSLCGSAAHSDAFDTKLYVVADLNNPRGSRVLPLACNDDFCGYQSQLTMTVQAGVAYGIIVDGFDGKFGTYELAITATQGAVRGSIPPPGYGQGGRFTLANAFVPPSSDPAISSPTLPAPQTPLSPSVPLYLPRNPPPPAGEAASGRQKRYADAGSPPPPKTRPGPPLPPLSPFLVPAPPAVAPPPNATRGRVSLPPSRSPYQGDYSAEDGPKAGGIPASWRPRYSSADNATRLADSSANDSSSVTAAAAGGPAPRKASPPATAVVPPLPGSPAPAQAGPLAVPPSMQNLWQPLYTADYYHSVQGASLQQPAPLPVYGPESQEAPPGDPSPAAAPTAVFAPAPSARQAITAQPPGLAPASFAAFGSAYTGPGSSTASISWSQAGLAGLIVGVAVALILILGAISFVLHRRCGQAAATSAATSAPASRLPPLTGGPAPKLARHSAAVHLHIVSRADALAPSVARGPPPGGPDLPETEGTPQDCGAASAADAGSAEGGGEGQQRSAAAASSSEEDSSGQEAASAGLRFLREQQQRWSHPLPQEPSASCGGPDTQGSRRRQHQHQQHDFEPGTSCCCEQDPALAGPSEGVPQPAPCSKSARQPQTSEAHQEDCSRTFDAPESSGSMGGSSEGGRPESGEQGSCARQGSRSSTMLMCSESPPQAPLRPQRSRSSVIFAEASKGRG